jgi:hypothetical protein
MRFDGEENTFASGTASGPQPLLGLTLCSTLPTLFLVLRQVWLNFY